MTPGVRELLDVRPKLRHDAVLASTAGGVLLRTMHAAVHVKGRSAHRLLAQLSPHLGGERTLGEICAGLGEVQRRAVVGLVGRLLEEGFILDDDPAGALPDPAVWARFRAQIEFLDHRAIGAVARFSRFRSARILVAGSGEALPAAAICLLRNGAAWLDLAPTSLARSHAETLHREAARLREQGLATSLRIDPTLVQESGHDLVVCCADQDSLGAVLELNRRCYAGGPPLVPLVTLGRRGILGPVVRRQTRGCWACASLRFAVNAPLGAPLPSIPTVARMLGSAAALEAFRLLTGALPADTEGAVVVQDLRTLESAREPLFPHPDCVVCAGPPAAGSAFATS